jgi:nicotinate-nucleotide adenylyltransferase
MPRSIGLFGGSFNPAHGGHLHVARAGLRQLALDEIWWLVSPQNPLKPEQPSWESRAKTVRALPLPPNMRISDIELQYQTQYTIDLLTTLRTRQSELNFVFMMGADNLLQLPKWRRWQNILETLPIAIIARPGSPIKARLGQAAQQYRHARIPEDQAHTLKYHKAPAWTYLTLPLDNRSSSAIRASSKLTS